jgi:fatty acid hydroxylase family protein
VPLYLLGFSPPALYAYLIFLSFHAVFIHANVRSRFRAVEWLVVTPRFHHWHHAAAPEAVDRNFAVHLPLLDRSSAPATFRMVAGRNPTACPAGRCRLATPARVALRPSPGNAG